MRPQVSVLVLLAGLALGGCADDQETDPGPADETTATDSSPTAESDPVELTVPGAQQGRCAPPTAEFLSGADRAFKGTVTDLHRGRATIRVEDWYHGDDAAETVSVVAPSKTMQHLLDAVDLVEGDQYLIAATDDDQVMLCGYTARVDPRLERLYEQAFAQ